MITTITREDLSALRMALATVETIEIRADSTGFSVKSTDDDWRPLGTVTETDDAAQLAYIGTAKVHASFYDRLRDRFLILAERPGNTDPWVVAYVNTMRDSEWESGFYTASYDGAVNKYLSRVVSAAT
jgi:hypothetical protein